MTTATPYFLKFSLSHTLRKHTKPINALRFSPDCQTLASGGSDAQICIWSTSKGSLLQTISCTKSGPVTDIIWATNKHNDLGLFFSCTDGSIHLYVRAYKKASDWDFKHIKTFLAHGFHIESLDFDPINRLLASVGKGEVKLWKVNSDWAVTLFLTEAPRGFIARSVHFFNEGNSIMVTYLESHRILAWNIYPWSFLWERPIFSRVGHAALASNGEYILVHNLQDGADAYAIPHMARHALCTFQVPVTIRKPKQVVFAASNSVVVQGSDQGALFIHDFKSTKRLQKLSHASDGLVQAVTSLTYREQHWIASGCSTKCPVVKIWKQENGSPHSLRLYKFLQISVLLLIFAVMAYVIPLNKVTQGINTYFPTATHVLWPSLSKKDMTFSASESIPL